MPVSVGDTICVSPIDLDDGKASPIKVEWKQDFGDRSEEYIQASFTVVATKVAGGKTGPETKSIIFIQVGKLADFQKKQVAGKDQFTIVIDSDFQYGQESADGTGRWIAFHDKSNTMFQHRFIQGLLAKGGAAIGEIAKQLGYPGIQILTDTIARLIGDYLHNFK